MKFEPMTFENVADGALSLEFEDGLESILADLDDPRKPGSADRTLTLKVTFRPSKDDNRLDVYVESSIQLPKRRAWKGLAVRDGHGLLQYRNAQQELPLEKVLPLPIRNREEDA